jgi:hypothetical protein
MCPLACVPCNAAAPAFGVDGMVLGCTYDRYITALRADFDERLAGCGLVSHRTCTR